MSTADFNTNAISKFNEGITETASATIKMRPKDGLISPDYSNP